MSKYRSHFHFLGMLKYLQTRLGLVQTSFPTIQCISLHPDIGFDGCICWFLSLVSDLISHTAVLGVNIAVKFFSSYGNTRYVVGENICPKYTMTADSLPTRCSLCMPPLCSLYMKSVSSRPREKSAYIPNDMNNFRNVIII